MLVTLVTAGIAVGAISVLTIDLLGSQRTTAILREQLFTRLHARSEVAWTMRRVRRQDIRQSLTVPQVTIGGVARPAITYIARRWDYRMDPPGANGDPYVVDRGGAEDDDDLRASMTGIIFQRGDALYRYEINCFDAPGVLGSANFNVMNNGQLTGFVTARLNDCEILAVDIDTFEVAHDRDTTAPAGNQYSIRWNIHLTPANPLD